MTTGVGEGVVVGMGGGGVDVPVRTLVGVGDGLAQADKEIERIRMTSKARWKGAMLFKAVRRWAG
jgi:hypothetical protein